MWLGSHCPFRSRRWIFRGGFDPGIHGGLAIVLIKNGTAPQLIDAIDIPVGGVGAKERVDVLAICTWIKAHQPQHALLERAQTKQGGSSGFKYGRAVGAIEAAIVCCGIPLTIVEQTNGKSFTDCAARTKRAADNGHCNCFRAPTRYSRARKIMGKARLSFSCSSGETASSAAEDEAADLTTRTDEVFRAEAASTGTHPGHVANTSSKEDEFR